MQPILWLVDFILLAGFWSLGILAVRIFLPKSRFLEQISLAYGLGIGIFTWLLFMLSWAGVPLNKVTVVFVFFFLIAILILGRKILMKVSRPLPESFARRENRLQSTIEIIGWVLLVVFSILLFVVSIGLSYYFWDAMAIWSVKGYGIGLGHSIFAARQWGAKGLGYPLNIPIAISTFYTADQDLLPGSKLLFPGFFIAMLIGIHEYLRRQNLPPWLAWCTVFAIGTTPLLLKYSLIGYANIPYAYYIVLGLSWIGLGLNDKDWRRVTVGAILLALSIWTRLEGLEFWLLSVLGLVLVWNRQMLTKKVALGILLPALVIGGIWILFGRLNHVTAGETSVLSTALTRMLHGELHPMAVYQIIRFTGYLVMKTRVYGIAVPVAIGLSLLMAASTAKVRKDKLSMTLLISGLITGLGVMFMYYLTSYDPMGLEWWLGTGYDRMLFGAVILLAAASVSIIWRVFKMEKE